MCVVYGREMLAESSSNGTTRSARRNQAAMGGPPGRCSPTTGCRSSLNSAHLSPQGHCHPKIIGAMTDQVRGGGVAGWGWGRLWVSGVHDVCALQGRRVVVWTCVALYVCAHASTWMRPVRAHTYSAQSRALSRRCCAHAWRTRTRIHECATCARAPSHSRVHLRRRL